MTITETGLYVAGFPIGIAGDDRLICWAIANAIFDMTFQKQHATFGMIMFNEVCSFAAKEPPSVAKVLKTIQ